MKNKKSFDNFFYFEFPIDLIKISQSLYDQILFK